MFKMSREFTKCTNKNIIEIKYSQTCLQSNPLFKKIIIGIKILKWNNFFNLNELCIENYLYIYNIKLIEQDTLLIFF